MKRLAVKRKAISALGIAVLLAALSVQTAVAAPEQEAKPSLTIQTHHENKGLPGLEWSAYQVAEMPRDGEYTLTTAFAASGLDVESLDGSTADEMQKSAARMVAFVKANPIDADRKAETDEDGTAKLEDMDKGLYLIVQSSNKNPDYTVKSQPFFVALPMMKYIDGVLIWRYDVTAVPKLEVTVPETEPTTENPTESQPTEEQPTETQPTEDQPTETQPTESLPPETVPPTYNPGHSGGSGGPGGPGGNSGGGPGETITIIDTPPPLASFLPPPDETGLIEIIDDPIPLAGFPFVPKMGDMGAGGYAAGMILSLLAGGGAFIRRKKYTGEEERTDE